VTRLRREFYEDLQTCKNFGFDQKLLDRANGYFENGISLIEESDERIVSQHCDFGPHNIFVKGNTLTVIDFEGMQDGLIYDDLAYFLCLVEAMPFYHLARGLKHKIRDAFLKGYAGKTDFDAGVLKFYQVPVMVKIAAHNPAFMENGEKVQFLRRLWRRRAYSKWLEARVK
jgi:thiamine kinase-like enzyme